ncbi:hypothetical protein SALBM217S_01805 [Streptomyces griseoloalbus]
MTDQVVDPNGVRLPQDAHPDGRFLGRTRELKELRADIERAGLDTLSGRKAPRARVLLIAGRPGSGRSALAEELVRQVAGDYPDGVLRTRLGEPDGTPVPVGRAARDLLDALGEPAPAGAPEDELAEALRTALAERRAVLLLDDAADAEQVDALLPDNPDCLAVAVSSGPLTGIADVRPCTLGGLDTKSGVELLSRFTGSVRITVDPGPPIAYETVPAPADRAGAARRLLAPMSEVAGRLSTQVGAYHLMRAHGGRGVLPGGVPGVLAGRAVVIGAGVSGWNAAQIAIGMGFHVTLLDKDINKLKEADKVFGTRIQTVVSNSFELEKACLEADLVIGAVLVPGAKAPKLVTNELVSRMKAGSVLVDIAIDQGGCFEDSRPTTHAEPTFKVHESVFYCVANMPGAVPNTSTYALTNATLPYIVELADRGWVEALRRDPALAKGLNTHDGKVVYKEVAEAHGLEHVELASLLG